MKLFSRPVIPEAHRGWPSWRQSWMTSDCGGPDVSGGAPRCHHVCLCGETGPSNSRTIAPPVPLCSEWHYSHTLIISSCFWHPDHNGRGPSRSPTFCTYLSASDVTVADVGLWRETLGGRELKGLELFQPFSSQKKSISVRFGSVEGSSVRGMLGWGWEQLKGEESRRWLSFFIFRWVILARAFAAWLARNH